MTPARPLLVAYYSRSGNTARVGHALAERLGADELAIKDLRGDGRVTVWRATLDRLLGTLPPIADPAVPLEDYDLVVLGTPVWGGRPASPMRRFLHDHGARLAQAAFFCTMGGKGSESTFAEMQERLGKPPRATCAIDAGMMTYGGYLDRLDSFASQWVDGRTRRSTARMPGTESTSAARQAGSSSRP
jgi:flavodoxin